MSILRMSIGLSPPASALSPAALAALREFFLVNSGALPYFYLRMAISLYAGYFS